MLRRIKARYFLSGLIFFSLFGLANAAGDTVTINTNLPGPYTVATGGPVAIIANAYYLALALGGLLAFGSIIFAGIKWTASRGNASAISDAQDQITQAVIGLLILLGTYLILNTINPTLTLLQIPQLSEVPGSGQGAPAPAGGPPAAGACSVQTSFVSESDTAKFTQKYGVQAAAMAGGQTIIWDSSDANAEANLTALHAEYNKLVQLASNNHFTVKENSVYRPLGYQQYFYDIKQAGTALERLTGDAATACSDLKASVDAARAKHGICQAGYASCYVAVPSGCSPHVMGKAVDIGITWSKYPNITDRYNAVAALLKPNNIGMVWKSLQGDEYHFEVTNPPAGCSAK